MRSPARDAARAPGNSAPARRAPGPIPARDAGPRPSATARTHALTGESVSANNDNITDRSAMSQTAEGADPRRPPTMADVAQIAGCVAPDRVAGAEQPPQRTGGDQDRGAAGDRGAGLPAELVRAGAGHAPDADAGRGGLQSDAVRAGQHAVRAGGGGAGRGLHGLRGDPAPLHRQGAVGRDRPPQRLGRGRHRGDRPAPRGGRRARGATAAVARRHRGGRPRPADSRRVGGPGTGRAAGDEPSAGRRPPYGLARGRPAELAGGRGPGPRRGGPRWRRPAPRCRRR